MTGNQETGRSPAAILLEAGKAFSDGFAEGLRERYNSPEPVTVEQAIESVNAAYLAVGKAAVALWEGITNVMSQMNAKSRKRARYERRYRRIGEQKRRRK